MTTASSHPAGPAARPELEDSTQAQVAQVASVAAHAARAVAQAPPAERARWLRTLADGLHARGPELCALADAETGLGLSPLEGEIARAVSALRFYADVAQDGAWLGVTIDHQTDTQPDLRRMNRALGPVAVFGASNFPFGFGVLGHDTASALAAGCPVIAKAHPAHPRLSHRLAAVALAALSRAGAPAGVFGMVFGYQAGIQLVTSPDVCAVAFTGSETGGMALWRLAATRDQPIPVFAEMGTVNAVIVTREAAMHRAQEVAAGFVDSFTLRLGQCCTKPGVLLIPAGSDLTRRIARTLHERSPQGAMLTDGIAAAYASGIEDLLTAGATVVASTAPSGMQRSSAPTLLSADVGLLQRQSRLLAECFGPVAIVAEYADDDQLTNIVGQLPGSLAACVQIAHDDDQVGPLVAAIAPFVGRVVVNEWPTGVAVTWSQHHGGPWPATTDPTATSVGADALGRFVRPVAYQRVPHAALPPALQDGNPWALPRRIDGKQII